MRDASQPLRAGDLRDRVRIEGSTDTLSDTGGIVSGGVTVIATGVPAAIEALPLPFQSREQQGAGGQQSALTHTIRMRYRTDVKPAMRIVELGSLGRTFEIIVPPQPDVRKSEIGLLCVQRVN